MSVFRVKLQNSSQGLLDRNAAGVPQTTSLQRTISINGPNRSYHHLKDGDQFTDCNYFKQFTVAGGMDPDKAFLEVVSDDGVPYSYDVAGNTLTVVTKSVAAGSTYTTGANNIIEVTETYGSPAVFLTLYNKHASQSIQVKLNGSSSAIFTLPAQGTQSYALGELIVSEIAFDNSASGAVGPVSVEVQLGLEAPCLS